MKLKSGTELGVTVCHTAMGWVGIAWSARGLVAVTLPRPTEGEALAQLPAGSESGPALPAGLDVAVLVDKLQRTYSGEVVLFDEPLDPSLGTEFQRRVWAAVRAIPPGQVCSYGQIAALVGAPGAARAVGQAMAHNPWPPIVPCHRIVGSDGRLTGFGGGLEMKRQMLAIEGVLNPLQLDGPFQ